MRPRDLRTREIEDTSDGTAPQPRLPANRRRPGAVGTAVGLMVVVVLGVAFFAAVSLNRNAQVAHGVSASGVPTAAPFAPTPSPTLEVSPVETPTRGTGLPAGVQVISFALTGADEGWGTGGVNMNSASGLPASSIVLHYAAGSWAQVGATLPGVYLGGIDMVSSSEGWVMGLDESSNQSLLLHISNGAWQQAPLPDDPHVAAVVMAMRTPTEGWMAMANLKSAYSGANTSLFHFAGGTWTSVPTPIHYITDIAPIADGEAWVIGWNADATSSLVQVRGGTATVVLKSPSNTTFSRLRVFAPDDIWIECAEHGPTNVETDDLPRTYHYDGARWSQMNLRLPQSAQHVGMVSSTTAWSFASILPEQKGATTLGIITSIYSNEGGRWQALSLPYRDLQSLEIVSSSSTDVWAIGVYMVTTSIANGYSSVSQAVLLHYAGGTWTEYGR